MYLLLHTFRLYLCVINDLQGYLCFSIEYKSKFKGFSTNINSQIYIIIFLFASF